MLVAQHLLLAATGCLAGLLARGLGLSARRSVVVGVLVSALPQELFYAHSILTEPLYGFFFMLSVLLFFRAVAADRALLWGITGALVAVATLVRPVGLSLAVALGAGILLAGRGALPAARALAAYCAGVGLVLGAFSAGGRQASNLGGVVRFGSESLFSNHALLAPEDVADPGVRQALTPFLLAGREKMRDRNWVQYDEAGPMHALRQLEPPRKDLDRVLAALTVEGIRSHPLRFAADQLAKAGDFLLRRSDAALLLYNPKENIANAGLYLWRHLRALPSSRLFVSYRDEHREAYFKRIRAFSVYPFDQADALSRSLSLVTKGMRWLPLLALAAAAMRLLRGGSRRQVAVLLLVVFAHIALTNLSADDDARHAVPVEPLYVVLCMLAFPSGRTGRPATAATTATDREATL